MDAGREGRWLERFGGSNSKKLVAIDSTGRDGYEVSRTERSQNRADPESFQSRRDGSKEPQRTENLYQTTSRLSYKEPKMYETSGQKDKNSSEYRLGEKMQNHEVQTPRSARSTHGGGPGVTTPRRGKVLLDETDRNQFQHHHSKSPSRLQAYQMADERVLSAKRHLREAPSPRKPKESQQKEHSRYDQEASGMREQAVYENYSRDLANLLIERELLRERSKDQKMAYDQHSRSRSAKVDFLDKHKADLERQKELKAHLVSVHDQYRQTNLKMAKERVQEKLQQTKADGEIMKKLVEYEQLKAEAAKAIKDKEAQRVQTYRNEVKAQALEDRKRHSDLQAKDRSVSPGFLGTIE